MNGLPKSTRRKAWERVLAALTARGTPLSGVVKTWQTWQGVRGEDTAWTAAMMPAVRVTPQAGETRQSADRQHTGPLVLDVTIGVPGTDAGDLMDLWRAIETTLFPTGDTTLDEALQEFGVFNRSIARPGIDAQKGGDGAVFLVGTGRITLQINIDA